MTYLKHVSLFLALLLGIAGCDNGEWATADQRKGSDRERSVKQLVAGQIRKAQEGGPHPDDLYSFYTLNKLGVPRFRNIEFVRSGAESERITCGEIAFGPFDDRATLVTTFMVLDDYVNIGTKDDRCPSSIDLCHESLDEMSADMKELLSHIRQGLSTGRTSPQQKIDATRRTIDSAASHCAGSEGAIFVVEANRKSLDFTESFYGD